MRASSGSCKSSSPNTSDLELNYTSLSVLTFGVVYPEVRKVAPQQHKMSRIKSLVGIADEFQAVSFGKVDKLDFRVIVVNERVTCLNKMDASFSNVTFSKAAPLALDEGFPSILILFCA
jgi:hypothetical protein